MNKYVCCMLAVVAGMVSFVPAQAVAIYQVTDMAGQSEHQLLTKEEYAKLSAELKDEAKVFSAVMAAAKKEWDASTGKENKMPFPVARIKLRQAKKMGSDFPDKDAAMKKLEQLEMREAEKIAREAKGKSGGNRKAKPDPEDVAKETLKKTLTANAITDVNRRMTEKLGRDVPMFGFMSSGKKDAKKDAAKKPAH